MRRGIVAILVPILVVGLAVAVHAAGKSPADLQKADVQLSGQDPIKIKKGRPGAMEGMVSVMVRLEQPPLAALSPGESIDVDNPATKQHLAAMEVEHRNFETVAQRTIPSAQMIHSLKVVFGGVSMVVPKDRVDDLRSLPGVTGVYPDAVLQPTTERSPKYIGAPSLWSELGGQESAGEGVVVGIIDGGIWPSPEDGGSRVQLFVEVDDVAATARKARALGAVVVVPPQVLPEGDEVAIIVDDEGISIGLLKPAAGGS